MYKVLIADDEEIIRRGIKSFIDKYEHLQVVAMAEDGEEALELTKEHQPDLLFVDINMPFLNGLDFIDSVKEILDEPLIIIITGYDSFKYTQKALRLNVFDYLLKPIMEDVFFESLERSIKVLDERKRNYNFLEQTHNLIEKNKGIFREEFLQEWMNGMYSGDEAKERMEYFAIEVPDLFELVVIQIDRLYETKDVDEWEEALLDFAIQNIIYEICEDLESLIMYKNLLGNLILIYGRNGSSNSNADAILDRIESKVQEIVPVRIRMVHGAGKHREEIQGVYNQLLNRLTKMNENPELVENTINYVAAHYQEPALSLQVIADEMHISPQYVSRMFKTSMGITIMEYITRIRMKQATRLLLTTNLKVYEIAEQVGYTSQHYFSNAFKKMHGMSPVEYKKGSQIKHV